MAFEFYFDKRRKFDKNWNRILFWIRTDDALRAKSVFFLWNVHEQCTVQYKTSKYDWFCCCPKTYRLMTYFDSKYTKSPEFLVIHHLAGWFPWLLEPHRIIFSFATDWCKQWNSLFRQLYNNKIAWAVWFVVRSAWWNNKYVRFSCSLRMCASTPMQCTVCGTHTLVTLKLVHSCGFFSWVYI